MLVPHISFDQNESPLSFAAFLAETHTGGHLVPFLHDFQVAPEDMASNNEKALSRLAEVSGVPLANLRANAAVRIGKRAYDLRGEMVSAEFLANPSTVFCPACLAEDDQTGRRRGRWEWSLSVVRTCPDHSIPLVRQAQAKWDDKFHELNRRVPERGDELDEMIVKAPRRSVSPLQDYVLRRLDGKSGPVWLDAQALDQASRTTELLGVLLAFGPQQKLPELTQDDWDHAGRVGFECTSQGEDGIRPALQSQIRKFDCASGTPGARKIFGCFYNALAHSKSLKEPGDIVRILREVIVENIALAAGEKVLGVALPERLLHTVASLAKEQELDTRTLRSVLVAADAIPENAPAHFPIPVGKGREVASRVKRMVHVISLPDFMNCARPLVDQLFSDRLLTPIYSGSPGVKGRTQKSVDQEEIAMLVGKLQAKAVLNYQPSAGMVPISKAAEKAKVPAVTVVHLILGGFLNRVACVDGQKGIGAIFVDPDEVKRQKATVTAGMSSTEVFAALKIPKEVGWRLVDHHDETAHLAVFEIAGPDQDHKIWRFDPDSVSRFKATFTTPARLAEQYDLQVGEVVGRLKRSSVRPAVSKSSAGVDFYRISDLREGLFT
jgi:hypothetical protein